MTTLAKAGDCATVDGPNSDERNARACLGAELVRRAEESQPTLEAAWDQLMTHWGIRGESVGAERLRAMIQQDCGTNPSEPEFSRELIRLREERRP